MTGESEEVTIARLDERVRRIEDDVKASNGQIEKIREEVAGLRRFQAWLLGGAAALGAMLKHFGDNLTSNLK
jgi:hypothetical protein